MEDLEKLFEEMRPYSDPDGERENDPYTKFFAMGGVDLAVDTMDRINYWCLTRMQAKFDLMPMEPTLCSNVSAGVVAEYGFKGGKEAVYRQLKALLDYRKSNPYTEADRAYLMKQGQRFTEHMEIEKQNPFEAKRLEIVRSIPDDLGDENCPPDRISKKQTEAEQLKRMQRENLLMRHLKKECICFFNSPLKAK